MEFALTREIYWNVGHGFTTLAPMYGLLLAALAVFVVGWRKRIRVYRQGQPLDRTDRRGERLRALVALPGEKIGQVGGPPDALYFVAAGEVVVHIKNLTVTLKEGDFFGEMGLLSSQPRTADVVAHGYCHLLALSRRDFNQLLASRPEARAKIEAVAKQRDAENASAAQAAS